MLKSSSVLYDEWVPETWSPLAAHSEVKFTTFSLAKGGVARSLKFSSLHPCYNILISLPQSSRCAPVLTSSLLWVVIVNDFTIYVPFFPSSYYQNHSFYSLKLPTLYLLRLPACLLSVSVDVEILVNDLINLVAGIAGSWDFILCIRSDSCAVSPFYILHRARDQRAHPRGNRGQMFIDFEVVARVSADPSAYAGKRYTVLYCTLSTQCCCLQWQRSTDKHNPWWYSHAIGLNNI